MIKIQSTPNENKINVIESEIKRSLKGEMMSDLNLLNSNTAND